MFSDNTAFPFPLSAVQGKNGMGYYWDKVQAKRAEQRASGNKGSSASHGNSNSGSNGSAKKAKPSAHTPASGKKNRG